MVDHEPKAELVRYLHLSRDALVWKLDGLSEYDVRRPMTPTGTNLLGMVKHVGSIAAWYFGNVFDRPFPEELPWFSREAERNADLWATADESRADILGLYERAWAHADATIDELPLDAVGTVPWWPAERRQAALHRVLVHMIAETDRHAGHADIIRELIDGAAGMRPDNANMPDEDAAWWASYHARLEGVARQAGGVSASGA